jgi:hypothetical protein
MSGSDARERTAGPAPIESAGAGLCFDCAHCVVVRSDRGSVFYRCGLAAADSRFPKYPMLPVLTCAGYEKGNNIVDKMDHS